MVVPLHASLFLVAAIIGIASWARHRDRIPAAWFGITFALLGAAELLDLAAEETRYGWLHRVELVLIAAVPFALVRLHQTFAQGSGRTRLATMVGGVGLGIWTLLVPQLPGARDVPVDTLAFQAYVLAFTVTWVALSAAVVVGFWRAGRGRPAVVRRRLRQLALGIGLVVLGMFALSTNPEGATWVASATCSAIGTVTALLAFAPPARLRVAWRAADEATLRESTAALMAATRFEDLAGESLEPLVRVLGGSSAALLDGTGAPIARWRADDAAVAAFAASLPSGDATDGASQQGDLLYAHALGTWTVVRVPPYAPLFGSEELHLLATTASLAAVAVERVRMIEEMRRLDQVKDNILSAVSHELRTPLASVIGMALTLRDRGDTLDHGTRVSLVDHLARESVRLERLLADLLDIDRLRRGMVRPRLQRLELRTFVEEVLAELPDEVVDRVVVELPDVPIDIDPGKGSRIVENLVANAARHTPAGCRCWIRARTAPDGITLLVEDDGPGVPPAARERIFRAFERAANEHLPAAPGTGIGLALVAQFASLHGGRAWVEDRDGGGASFRVWLPAASDAVAEPAELAVR